MKDAMSYSLRAHALLITLLYPYVALAGDTGATSTNANPITRLDISNLFRLESATGTSRGQIQKLEALFEPQIELDIGEDLQVTATGRLRADPLDEIEPGDPSRSTSSDISRRALIGDSLDLELREFYFETSLGRTLITLGKQQIVWGQADGLKVLDIVNPQSFREFILDDFRDSRIGLWALNVEQPIGTFVLQGVWLPDQTYHERPEPDSVFAFRSPLLVPSVPGPGAVITEPPQRPSRVVADSDVGVQLSTFWAGWDLTLNYLYHYDDTPVFGRRATIINGGPAVLVSPEYRRTHLVGGTFSKAFGSLTLRGEVGALLGRALSTGHPADANGIVQTDELTYVVGLDWFGIEETLVSIQLFQSVIADDLPGLPRDGVETNVTLLLRHETLNDTLVLETMWLHGVNRGDGVLRPKIRYALDDHTTVWVGVDWFYGGAGGLFGQFDPNDRLVVGLEWAF